MIVSSKFPILEGEESELVNKGFYGKALCQYLQDKLTKAGYQVPFYCCEDWGWWVELKGPGTPMGLLVYCMPEQKGDPKKYAIMSSITDEKMWSWRKLRKIEVGASVKKVMDDLEQLLKEDKEIDSVTRHDEYPG